MARKQKPRVSNKRGLSPAARSRGLADNGQLQAPTIIRYASPEPFNANLPNIKDLNGLDNTGLSNVLSRFGIVEPWPQQRAAAVGYLNRMTNYPIGSPQFKAEMSRMLDFESKAGLLKASRRAYQDYALSITDTGGLLVRICEDDENSCEPCIRLGGEEGTIDYHRSLGLPGSQSCDGGDLCRCSLVAS